MMDHHARSESLFYYFRLEDRVPENHLLRLIAGVNIQSDLSVQPKVERELAWSSTSNTTEIAMK